MLLTTTVVVAILILVGLVGIVVPVMPGTLLILGATLVWALVVGSATGWWVFATVVVLLALGAVAKYALPGRALKSRGVPTLTLVLGGILGIVGFFVIPVVGLLVGFVLGVYLAELRRVGQGSALTSTRHTVKAVGVSILIELGAGLLAAATWLIGVLLVW